MALCLCTFINVRSIKIDNIYIVFDNNELTKVDGIKFETIEGISNVITVRSDVRVFSFLNMYGLLGYETASTSVQFIKFDIQTTQHFSGVNYGLGTTLAGVLGLFYLHLVQTLVGLILKSLLNPFRLQIFHCV